MMSLNLTLFGQMITFAIFVWVTMRYVWPPISQAMQSRQKTIADGLAAAERGKNDLELAQHKAADMLREAKIQSGNIIEQATQRANHLIEESKTSARTEGERLIVLAREEIDRQVVDAKQVLREEVVSLAIESAQKLLERNLDDAANNRFLDDLIKEVED